MKSILCFFFVIFISCYLNAQENKPYLGLAFVNDFPTAHKILRDYDFVPSSTDISMKSTYSLGGTLTYYLPIKKRWNISLGLLGGIDGKRYNIIYDKDFSLIELEKEFYREKSYLDYPFGGLSLGVRYNFVANEKNKMYLGLRGDAIYFLNQIVTNRIFLNSDTERVMIFSSTFFVNNLNEFVYSPVVNFGYSRNLGKKFYLNLQVNTKFNIGGRDFVEGTYTLFGRNEETKTGNLSKSWLAWGFSIESGYYFSKKDKK